MITSRGRQASILALALTFCACQGRSARPQQRADQVEPQTKTLSRPDKTTEPPNTTRPDFSSDLERYSYQIKGSGVLWAIIKTSKGSIRCSLLAEKAPIAVANFLGLARGKKAWRSSDQAEPVIGEPYYDGLRFHRIMPGFAIQSGDRGPGSPGFALPDEDHDQNKHDRPGLLSMVRPLGPNTAGAQFLITARAAPVLDGQQTVFGRCVDHKVIKAIAAVAVDDAMRPREAVELRQITFVRATQEEPPRL